MCPRLDPLVTYGGVPNISLVEFIGAVHGRVLDIGCGEGTWAGDLRRGGAEELVGVEVSSAACERARTRYDAVLESPVESLDFPEEGGARFDLVIAADVLEHLQDPWETLRRSRSWGKRIAVSVPNLRYHGILGGLLVRGEFEYVDEGGLMDRSHLRWFTKKSLDRALRASGWQPVRWGGSWGPKRRMVGELTFGLFNELLWHQLHVIAE
jgi:SAM-dependent methyltransferase